ncbi:SusC/RagA family TonB-linked outer membrane protein [Hymenobacter chitinivorans]|uniref:TonB-linked SusC/RagA family outer membrane protein n=1 Tax=Hymenobacter chitinivorans DSM 11115 TaxID=1121954 RepID=A0A2M9BPU0_9BACT|nr:TonB-dependent receptor [Hymenobacter chitinivorans]PJJ59938.1 TonB-linked SusC/RagA family outer membrane protein [Hymenobacter chitinivorans DSM 11115]
MKKLYYVVRVLPLLVLLLLTGPLLAQNRTITGKVTTAENNETLPGVTVVLKGTTIGTGTNPDGTFSLSIPAAGGTLVFSFVGYLTKEVALGTSTNVNVVLSQDAQMLAETVVVGYGTQKASNVTGAIAGVTAKEIEERPVNRIENALAGQMPGVTVQTVTGEPGAELQIRVRGTGSINASNEPLYVVDGVPVENLRGINPTDVANIEVLKDAASAAIYGSRGSNGVVLVTTKRGKKGKAKLQFSGYTGVQTLERRIDMMTPEQWIKQRQEGVDEAWVNRGKTSAVNKPYKASDPMEYRAKELNIPLSTPNPTYMYDPRWAYGTDSLDYVDWQDAVFRKAVMQQYQIGVSGGSDDFSYNVNGSYLDQDGIFVGTNLKRATLRANFDARIRKGIKLTMTLAPSTEWSSLGRVDGKDNQAMNAVQMPPVSQKGAGVLVGAQPFPAYAWSGRYISPVAVMERSDINTTRTRLNANMGLNVDIYKGLQLQLLGAMDNNYLNDQQFFPTNTSRDWATATYVGQLSRARLTQGSGTRYLFQSVLNYTRKLGDHSVNAIAGYSVERFRNDGSVQEFTPLPNDWSPFVNRNNATPSISDFQAPDINWLLSYFGRVQYDYKEKYLVSASLRRDGSAKFGQPWGYFPAVSVGWRVSSEEFMRGITAISDLKLRASYGVTGNNRIPSNAQFSILASTNYSLNGVAQTGFAPGSYKNENLGWERTGSFNVGFDFGMLSNRIQISADAYNRRTKDLLLRAPISSITGYTTSWQNVGDIRNQGLEVGINSQNMVGAFTWGTSFNTSYNRNEVLALDYNNTPIVAGFSNLTQIIQVGQPLNAFLLYDVVGVYKTQEEVNNSPRMSGTKVGDSKYRDVNGDGIITEADRTIVGNPQPKFIFGITNNFTYRNFDLSFLINAQQGGQIYSMIGRSIDRPGMGYLYNKLAKWENRWQSEEIQGDGMTPSINATTGAYYDTRWLYSSDYIRLKNITLGYNLPKLKYYDRARFYVAVENAYIWHKYSGGFTPEAANNEGGDYGGYPQARTFTLGFNVTL